MGLRGIGLVGRFALSFFLIKYLGTTQTGQFGLIVGIAGTLPALYGLGMNYFLSREIIKADIEDSFAHIRDKFLMMICLLALTFAGALIVNLFHPLDALGNIYLAGIVIFMEVLCFDMHLMLISLRKPMLANVLVLVRSASWVFPFIGLSLLYPNLRTLNTLLLFWLTALVLNFAALWLFTRDWPWLSVLKRGVDFKWMKTTIKSGVLVYLSDLGLVVYSYFDRFFLAAMLGLAATGVYTFYWTMANALLVLIAAALLQTSLPPLVDAFAESEQAWRKKFRTTFIKAMIAGLAMTGFMYAAFIFVLPFLDNPELGHHPYIFPLMLAATVVRVGADMTHYGLYSRQKDKTLAIINISGIAVNMLLTISLVSGIGLLGVALSMLGTSSYLLLSRGYFLYRSSAAQPLPA